MRSTLLAAALLGWLLGAPSALRAAGDDDNPHAYLTRIDAATALAVAQRWDAARTEFRAASGLDPDDALAYLGLGLCELAHQRPDAAAPLFRRAVMCARDGGGSALAVATTGLGLCAFSYGDLAAAENYLRQALANDAQIASACFYRGLLALCRGHLDDVGEWLDRARGAGLPGVLVDYVAGLRQLALGRGEAQPEAPAVGLPLVLGLRLSPAESAAPPRISLPRLQDLPSGLAPVTPRSAASAAPASDGPLRVDNPLPDSVVTGRVPIRVSLDGARRFDYVSILVDGRVRSMTNREPIDTPWDTTDYGDGRHTIEVKAAGGPREVAVRFWVTVRNTLGTARVEESPTYDALAHRDASRRLGALLVHRLPALGRPATPALARPAVPAPNASPDDLREPAQAIAWCERTLAAAPTRHDVMDRLVRLYRQQGLAIDVRRMPEPHTGVVGARRVALTFDDGPRPGYTEPILALLAQYRARGTFLVTGLMCERYPALAKTIAREGHELGSHTYNHYRLDSLDARQVVWEMVKTKVVLDEIVGGAARFMRPPGGHYNAAIRNQLAAVGYFPLFWNINCGAYARLLPDEAADAVMRRLCDGSILLLHNGGDNTLPLLPVLLARLRAAGYTMVTVSDILRPPGAARPEHVSPGPLSDAQVGAYAGTE